MCMVHMFKKRILKLFAIKVGQTLNQIFEMKNLDNMLSS